MAIKLGYQLSSITPYINTAESIEESFEKIARIGYRDVQLQGIPIDLDDNIITGALKNTGLNCVATQEDYILGFGDNPDRYIERALACSADYFSCALVPYDIDSREGIKAFSDILIKIVEKVQKAGMIFSFHPIPPDFRMVDGETAADILMDFLPQNAQLTFCVNAAFGAGISPDLIFNKYKGRMDLVHFKDDILLPNGERQLMPLGQGGHDFAPIIEQCHVAGVKYIFAEQERWLKDAFLCAEESYNYIKSLNL